MTQGPLNAAGKVYCFGPFRLDVERRELLQDGQPVHLRAREFDILLYLVERPGAFVTKEELTEKVWAVTFVSDANIRVQIAALRRVLGDGRDNSRYIISAAGRGYSFCAPLLADTAVTPGRLTRAAGTSDLRYNLPIRLKPTLGRGEASHRLISHLPYQRLVTIVGAGGIGKTTLALTAAEGLIDAYDDGVRFVDLASLSDPALIVGTMAATVGLTALSPEPEDELVKCLEDKQLLFIVDNCEHLIEAVASLVENILTRTRDVHFLATSREPLRADGEWLFRLGPLDVPPRTATLTAAEAIAYPAVKLFVERARLGDSLFEFLDADALTVAELCRRLDGNPLAVELAAARVGLFGIQGLAAQLDESFNTLTQGRRTALPRHQTLRATLDWSYEILSPSEQALLYRLSIFRGEFTLTTARAVASTDPADEIDVFEGLAGLTAKSLINVDVMHQPARYRMLFLTRDYAFEKLAQSGEFNAVASRHALKYLELLRSIEASDKDAAGAGWIDDIRTAIDWAFSPAGDILLGMKLISASIELGTRLSLFAEYGQRVKQALERMPELVPPEPMLEMRLLIEQTHIILHTVGDYALMQVPSTRALKLAEDIYNRTGDSTPLFEVLAVRFGIAFGSGDSPSLLSIAQKAFELSPYGGDQNDADVTTNRMLAQACHFVGDHRRSMSVAQKVMDMPEAIIRTRNYMAGDRHNPFITMRIFQARCYWIVGQPDLASAVAREAAQLSESQGVQLCYALGMAVIPVALWRGNYIEAKAGIARLFDVSQECGLGYWTNWARTFQTVMGICENDAIDVEDPLELFEKITQDTIQRDQLATFHDSLATPASLDRVEAGLVGWNAPEVLRATAERRLAAGGATPAEAEALLLRSLDMARQQQALSWQVRTVTSLGRLWGYQGRVKDAQILLSDTLKQVSEGFGDSDYIAAEALLADLAQRMVQA